MIKKIFLFVLFICAVFVLYTGTTLATADITIVSGPEILQKIAKGSQVNIRWDSTEIATIKVKIIGVVDYATTTEVYVSQVPATNKSIGLILNYPSGLYAISVESADDEDISDFSEPFYIYDPSDTIPPPAPTDISVTHPAYYAPETLNFKFTAPTVTDFYNINIYRSTVSGQLGTLVSTTTPFWSSFLKFQIYDENLIKTGTKGTVYYTLKSVDISGNESINSDQASYSWDGTSGSINVTSPTASSNYKVGETITIRWTMSGSVGPTGKVEIRLYKGDTYKALIKSSVATSSVANEYSWVISSYVGATQTYSDYKIRITSADNSLIYDESDNFSIGPAQSSGIIVTQTPHTPNLGYRGGKTSVLTLNIKNNLTREINIALLSVRLEGTAKTSDVGNVYWHDQSGGVIGVSNFGTDGSANRFASIGGSSLNESLFSIPANSYKTITVHANVSWDAVAGRTIIYNMPQDSYIYTTDRLPISGLPITSQAVTISENIASACFPNGTLLRVLNNPEVYVIIDCKKKWIKSADEFNKSGYNWADIAEFPEANLWKYPDYIKIIKTSDEPKVYKIVSNKKLWLPTTESFNKLRLDWSDIQLVSKSEIDNYQRLKLAKTASDPKIYYLTESGLKRHIINETVFLSYGNKWEDVVELSESELAIFPDSVLVKDPAGKVFLISDGKKYWYKTPEAFNKRGGNWNVIAPVNQVEIDAYPDGEILE